MVGYLPHCTFDLNPRAASIDTPLHAFLPYKHVDHMHPDAVIAIAASKNSRALTKEIYGDSIGWLPWRRPGFELGLMLEKFARENPKAIGVVLESHGLFTWGQDGHACYETTHRHHQQGDRLARRKASGARAAGLRRRTVSAEEPAARRAIANRLMPAIRGQIGKAESKIGHFDDPPAVLEFVNSKRLAELAALGTSCPDHFLRTKIRPLVVDYAGDAEATLSGLGAAIDAYRDDYAAYYERCKHADSPAMRDPNPVVYLVPRRRHDHLRPRQGDGAHRRRVLSQRHQRHARRLDRRHLCRPARAGGLRHRVLAARRGQAPAHAEAEEPRRPGRTGHRRRRRHRPRGRGASSGGGGCVVLADIDEAALGETTSAFSKAYGKDNVRGVVMDVTDEAAVIAAFADAVTEYGGLDILVSNAGISSASPIEDTTLATWNRNMDILATGYFLVSREAFRLMKRQKLGGSIVFVASKNGLAASPNASAYCTAKAAEIHLARCLALEGAPLGIRVNVVNPDAVLRGSKIWTGEWREQRAAAYKMKPDELEEHYRQRSMLKRSVLPEDVAEAIYFLASDLSAKSTGNIINVDAGNAQSFTR